MSGDIVGTWEIAMPDGLHKVEFEHGTTSGKRVIRVDGKELKRVEWMFKLVGRETFKIGKASCLITIEAVSGFAYEYTLEVNGKSLQKFTENQSKIMNTWVAAVDGVWTRVVLEKGTLDIWVNGRKVETTGEFTEDGTETHFSIGETTSAFVQAISSGKRRTGIIHKLFINDNEIPEATE